MEGTAPGAGPGPIDLRTESLTSIRTDLDRVAAEIAALQLTNVRMRAAIAGNGRVADIGPARRQRGQGCERARASRKS
jgi:hypothetical protein